MTRARETKGSRTGQSSVRADRTNVERLLEELDIRAQNLALYQTALTHRSAAAQPWPTSDRPSDESNERLEFLGDAVLGTVVAEALYQRFPGEAEGSLTRTRSAIVRTEQLALWADEFGLVDLMFLAQGERNSMSGRERILAGAFEALIGAIYLDKGLATVSKFIRTRLDRDVEELLQRARAANPKGKLQEITQEAFQRAPVYTTVRTEGPPHDRQFTVEVSFDQHVLARGEGASKRAAEEAAATLALERFDREGMDFLTRSACVDTNVGQ